VPSSPSHAWPLIINISWLLLLLVASKDGGNASFVTLVVVLASISDLLAILIALLRRRWAVAKWYSLAWLVVLGLGAIALTFIDTPLYQDE
jgi:hypothetical protein